MCIARVMEKGLLVCTHGRLVDVWTFGRWSAWKDVCVCTIEKLCNSKIESLLSRDARCLNCITLHETECLCVFRAPGEPEDLHRFIVISWPHHVSSICVSSIPPSRNVGCAYVGARVCAHAHAHAHTDTHMDGQFSASSSCTRTQSPAHSPAM